MFKSTITDDYNTVRSFCLSFVDMYIFCWFVSPVVLSNLERVYALLAAMKYCLLPVYVQTALQCAWAMNTCHYGALTFAS